MNMRPHARWNLTLAALLAAAWTATHIHAQVLPAAKPAPALAPSAVAKPLNPAGTRAATGPGTQTEDDVYVGNKRTTQRPVQGVTPPTTGTPAPRPGAAPRLTPAPLPTRTHAPAATTISTNLRSNAAPYSATTRR
jgi:hypothetical protein